MVVSSVVKNNEKVNDKNGELGIFSNESLCLNLKIIFFNQSLNQKKMNLLLPMVASHV